MLSLGLALVGGPARAADEARFSQAQLEEMIAPIALYPDEVLSTVCIAATYPLEVVEADRWRDKNPSLQGPELEKALGEEDWDASVKSLTSFPDVLDRMSSNLDWTRDLGDAFLEQRTDLMDAAQRLRGKAYEAGTLKTTPQQTVVKEKETVYIQPADPQTVYVPAYAPATVYGSTYAAPATPSYPSFWATPGGTVTAGVLGFGAGITTAALIGSAFDWDDHDVYVNNYYGGGGRYGYGHGGNVNVDRNVNVSANRTNIRANRQQWSHDGSHRRGVGYRDQTTAQRYGGRDRLAAKNRPDRGNVRGFEAGAGPGGAERGRPGRGPGEGERLANRPGGGEGLAKRPGGGEGLAKRPGDASRPAQRPHPQRAQDHAAKRPPARAAGERKGAFGDARGGHATVDASRRGAASRGAPSRAGSGGGPGGGRGGGMAQGRAPGGRAHVGGGGGRGGGHGGGGRGGGGRGGGGRHGGGGRRR